MNFNQTTVGKNKTVNREGHAAYKMSEREDLVTKVLTSFFKEAKFYGDTDKDMIALAEKTAKNDPEFLTKLALYTRREFNLRSVYHALVAVIAKNTPIKQRSDCVKTAVKYGCLRGDDVLEIMAAYKGMYGKPFPNSLKKSVAEKMNNMDAYSIGKYNRDKDFRFRDLLRLTHPKPLNKAQNELFKQILDDAVPTPYTWETELSAKGNNAETWNELIQSGKVGYMALLRNLKNIIISGADIDPVLDIIADPQRVKKSKQLPFRYLSAYKRLNQEGLLTKKISTALSKAAYASLDNLEVIPGNTLIAIDTSGSMGWNISGHSDIKPSEIAGMIGVMANHLCEDAVICTFNTQYKIVDMAADENLLKAALTFSCPGGGTNMYLPMEYALHRSRQVFDRVIYLSDNVCNCYKDTVQKYADEYRRTKNPDFWVHAVDIQGYGTQQFYGNKFNLIAGWSEKVLSFINMAEAGVDTQVKAIEKYDYKSRVG